MLWEGIACSSSQPFLKEGLFPAQVKAEFRVRLQLVFIGTAGNKSVGLLSFYEIPMPGHSLLQLTGTSPPLARGFCSGMEAEPHRQTEIWQLVQTRGWRSECLGAGRAAKGDRDFLGEWQICFRTFFPPGNCRGLCRWSSATRLLVHSSCRAANLRGCKEVKKTEVTVYF